MNAKILLLAAALIVSGCSSQAIDQSPTQTYRPAWSADQISITGKMDTEWKRKLTGMYVGRKVTVLFNGETVISGWLTDPDNAAGTLIGTYEKRRVDVDCTGIKRPPNTLDVRCLVLVNNERAATLTF
jgi:uncharacterized protein YceK